MKATKKTYLKLMSLVVALLFPAFSAASTDLRALLDEGKLKVEVFLSVEGQTKRASQLYRAAAVNEQIDLIVKVSTDRWFTRGTRVTPLSLNQALVQQRDKLASNYTEKLQGQTWSVQEWQLAIYPLDSGRFHIPNLTLAASVSLEEGGSAEGYIQTPSVSFEVMQSNGVNSSQTPASTDVQFGQTWNELDDLKVGGAITRTLHIKADETTVSLLPELNALELAGTNSYSEVLTSKDMQSRGRYSAEKTVVHTYIVHNSGTLMVPPIGLEWWDTNTQSLRSVELTGLEVNIPHTPKSWLMQYWVHCIVIGLLISLLTASIHYFIRRFDQGNLPPIFFLMRSLVLRNWREVHRHLYNQTMKKTGRVEIRGSVPEKEVNEWSEQHFSPSARSDNARVSTVIKLWKKISNER